MSVLIKGMEMPKKPVAIIICPDSKVFRVSYPEQIAEAVPVPLHGRVIDADALIIDLMDRGVESLQTDDWHEIQQAVMDAPTIIPTGEGK